MYEGCFLWLPFFTLGLAFYILLLLPITENLSGNTPAIFNHLHCTMINTLGDAIE